MAELFRLFRRHSSLFFFHRVSLLLSTLHLGWEQLNVHFIKNVLRTSAVSSTNFRSILIFASCVVGTCNILYRWVFIGRGPIFCIIMVSVGIFTLGVNF